MYSEGGSKWEALLFIFLALNKSAQEAPVSGVAVKCDISGESALVARREKEPG